MSKLLIDDRPVMILPKLATRIGLNEAIVLQQLHYWLVTYREAEKRDHFREGRWWVYNTKKEWTENFPWWSESTVWRALTNLRDRGLVETASKYNRKGYDRTLWYTIDYEALSQIEKAIYSKWQNASSQNEQMDLSILTSPIPETTTETTTETINNKDSTTSANASVGAPPFFPDLFNTAITNIKAQQFTRREYRAILDAEKGRGDDARVTLVRYLERKLSVNQHPAIQAYRDVTNYYPPKSWRPKIAQAVGANGNLDRWENTVTAWIGLGWNPKNVKGMLEFFGRGEIPGEDKRHGQGEPTGLDAFDAFERQMGWSDPEPEDEEVIDAEFSVS